MNLLQERLAALPSKEDALWLPSGTMSNQVALRVLTRPGDEAIVSRECHAAWHQAGGSAANAGAQMHEIGELGAFTAKELETAIKPRNWEIFPPGTVVEIENTHNRARLVEDHRHARRLAEMLATSLSVVRRTLSQPTVNIHGGR